MASIIDLINNEVKIRPAMYIGRNSIFCLQAFLNGLCWHKSAFSDNDILSEFQDYIEKEYAITTTHSWASIIHFFSQDETDALMNFFIEFDKFLKTR